MAGDAGSRPIYIRQGVAEIIGIAEATVKTCMFYARKKLAALVATA
jgi:DNA-directed RNA polymerase specialized sigma24 family protein